jgi:hypothetical protein
MGGPCLFWPAGIPALDAAKLVNGDLDYWRVDYRVRLGFPFRISEVLQN